MSPWLAALLLLLACGEPLATEPAEPPTAPGDGPAPAAVVRNATGTFDVSLERVPRARALDLLADAAGFGVVPGRGRPAPEHVSVKLAGATADEALAAILAGVPYHVHHERGPDGGAVTLRRVTVGPLPPPAQRGEGRARLGQRVRERRIAAAQLTPDEIARLRLERRERHADRRAWIERLRDSPDERERARAAAMMRADRDLDALVGYLLEDRSPEVRERAAESLADASAGEDAITASEALIEALSDPEPQVVAAAVSALEDVHDTLPDARIRDAVAALRDDPDPAVRDAVEDFVRWTEE